MSDPTPIPLEIPRIPSKLDSFLFPPKGTNTVQASPNFPHLGPSAYDLSPDRINTIDMESPITPKNFVPPAISANSSVHNLSLGNADTQVNSNTSDIHISSLNENLKPNSRSSSTNGSETPLTPYTLENISGGARPIVHSADLEEVPVGVSRQARHLSDYQFPTHRLANVMLDETKSPLVIVACGSFSPITYLHLRMFEMAMDSIREETRFEVIGGYYSPVSDNYKKQGLAEATHRVRMCELACERTSSWLMVDAWESLQPNYQRTAVVLDHFNHEINIVRGGIATSSGKRKGVKIMLLAGGDLIESMGEPNVWANEDLHHILGRYGCLIVERTGSDVRSFLLSHDIMYEHRRNVLVIKQLIYNDISSTKVRLFIRRGMSVQYLIPNSVIRYIQENGLYIHETEPVKQVLSEKGD
jgi:nicotinamide mononucleotide adenylyltransferase